ncbi:glycosyltransferase [Siphonobacter sp.]|uniref:glycosyltransferase n=1 Tax=Siphonobacter sp. TaxID=1869184 RepID=UPI003B3A8787
MDVRTLAYNLWLLLQLSIGYNLVLPVVLLVGYLIRKAFVSKRQSAPLTLEPDYAIIVTAYEQTVLLPSVVASLLKLNYTNYVIYIVADKCDISTLHFDDPRVQLLRPEQVLASNTRSHFYAIQRFIRPHERLTIIDSDNLVDSEYLNELNRYFAQGFTAVQGIREAKNLDTTFSCLDAARDIYYHFYDGKVLFEVGSSATLAGSGMAFTTELYRASLEHLDVTGAGFDKVLQKAIVGAGHRIAFTESAIVYDEKTAQSDQLVKQRARWINTWFKYFSYGFGLIFKGITTFNWNQFVFGLILLRPPLFIFLLLSVVFMLINVWVAPTLALVWLLALLTFVAGFLIALLLSDTHPKIYKSLWNIPRFMLYQIMALLKVRKANQISVATKHGSSE